VSKEEIIAAIRECAEKVGRAPSFTELKRTADVTQRAIRKNFGTYTRALEECGMERQGCGKQVPLDALFTDWAEIVRRLRKLPSVAEYQLYSQYSIQPLFTRFGNWRQTPLGLLLYAEERGLEKEWKDVLDMVRESGGKEDRRGGRGKRWNAAGMLEAARARVGVGAAAWTGTGNWASAVRTGNGERELPKILPDRPTYGPALMPAALAHGPTNELGVIYLFGMLASRLGFVVMRIQAEFPDCEAMRRVEGDRWQKVRIEFEFESRNFLKHLHRVEDCDLIVCWEHNWEGCPLEVVELRKALSNQQSAFSPVTF